ncbi:MAG: sorbosone dehydrogenase family protein [Gammaproteobacteria bacterium]|nr:MAG: sorbosone dehydrogenase family protein [Gammaproteobacteria bacterium]
MPVGFLIILLGEPALSESLAPAVLQVPPGFRIQEVARVPNARSMVLGARGTLFVSSRFSGQVHAVAGVLGDHPQVYLLDEKLRVANGIAFLEGDLYVAEPGRLLRYASIESNLDDPGEPEVVADDLPTTGKLHSWKYIAFGPDGKLYMSVGSPCNICDEPDYGLIVRMNRDGTDREIYARGIRNTVGFDWQPGTGELWFTDNNRDLMGDDEPPGELNRVARTGLHFGFPFCHGLETVEPKAELAALGTCADSEPPVLELPAHVAPLGLAFYHGDMFPDAYHGQIFIAEHGSWNRSEKIGYRVSLVQLDKTGQRVSSYEPFIEGWLRDDEVSGRPVDVLVAPDGSLLVSDDKEGRIFRVTYVGTATD